MGESDFRRSVCFPQECSISVGILDLLCRQTKTTTDLSGPSTLPVPNMPCSLTPPQSPATIARCGGLLLPSRHYDPVGLRFNTFTRLNSFTCVTACSSLCLRLAHVVTFMSPRLDSRWGGSFPFPGREFHPLEASGLS